MRALELPRPRLLLADGVGLGKTIETGLIACELIARRRAHRVLSRACRTVGRAKGTGNASRFGLRFTAITDAASLQQQRRKLELGGNPFDAIALCMTSLDFAKQERMLEELAMDAIRACSSFCVTIPSACVKPGGATDTSCLCMAASWMALAGKVSTRPSRKTAPTSAR
jgi:hypothetical protein